MINDAAECLVNGRKLEPLILRKQFRIKILSDSEMRLLTSERLMTNSLYRIEMVSGNNEKIKPTAEVVSSFLRETQSVNDAVVPIYEVNIKFIQMDEHEKKFLKNLISELKNRAKNLKNN